MANEGQWKQGQDWARQNPNGSPPPNAPQDWKNGAWQQQKQQNK